MVVPSRLHPPFDCSESPVQREVVFLPDCESSRARSTTVTRREQEVSEGIYPVPSLYPFLTEGDEGTSPDDRPETDSRADDPVTRLTVETRHKTRETRNRRVLVRRRRRSHLPHEGVLRTRFPRERSQLRNFSPRLPVAGPEGSHRREKRSVSVSGRGDRHV